MHDVHGCDARRDSGDRPIDLASVYQTLLQSITGDTPCFRHVSITRFGARLVPPTTERQRARETRYVRMNRSRLKGQLGSDQAQAATAVLFQVPRPFPRRMSYK